MSGAQGGTIGVVGLGLIGGSLCRALSRVGHCVLGVDNDPRVVSAAIESGAVAQAGAEPELLARAETVFIALYPHETIEFVRKNAAVFRRGAVVIDCCGVKEPVCGALFAQAETSGFTFMGGHPMAGIERSGFEASSADLFEGASFLLVPGAAQEETVREAESLILSAGFARVVRTTPQEHDRMIAYTSQLPHVLACAYVMSPCCPRHDGFSAGSFRDVSRVAHLSADMWAQLFIDNRAPLCAELDTLIANIEKIRDAAGAGDVRQLQALLAEACRIKDSV
ncbi:MAG: prephenate dehydrogenase [Clostridia bacterium]|nr:prephenate dehydrogenase [Clostridia bacterium]